MNITCDLCKSDYWKDVVRKYRIISSDCYFIKENHVMNLCPCCVKLLTSQKYHVKLKEVK